MARSVMIFLSSSFLNILSSFKLAGFILCTIPSLALPSFCKHSCTSCCNEQWIIINIPDLIQKIKKSHSYKRILNRLKKHGIASVIPNKKTYFGLSKDTI